MSQPFSSPGHPGWQPVPPPDPFGGAPTGQIVLHMLKPWGIGSAMMVSPKLTIDGFPAPVQWEQNVITVPAGQRRVTIAADYLWTFGQAETVVDVYPGQSIELHYSSPMLTFLKGRVGPERQPRPGAVGMIAVFAALLLIILVPLIAAIISST